MSKEDDLATAIRLVSGGVGLCLVQLRVGAGELQLGLDSTEDDGRGADVCIEGQVIFNPGSDSELRCEPYTLAALERLLPVLNKPLDLASVREDGSLQLSFGDVTVLVSQSDRYSSWSYGGTPIAGDTTMSEGIIYCVEGGRLDIFTNPQ